MQQPMTHSVTFGDAKAVSVDYAAVNYPFGNDPVGDAAAAEAIDDGATAWARPERLRANWW